MSSKETENFVLEDSESSTQSISEHVRDTSLEKFEMHIQAYSIPAKTKREITNRLATITARIHDERDEPAQTREKVISVFTESVDIIEAYQKEYNPQGVETNSYVPEKSVCWFATKYTEKVLVDCVQKSTAESSIKLLIRKKLQDWEEQWEEYSDQEVTDEAREIVEEIVEEERNKSDGEVNEEKIWSEYERRIREKYKALLADKEHMKHQLLKQVESKSGVKKSEVKPEFESIHQELKKQGARELARNHREMAEERIDIDEGDSSDSIIQRIKSFIKSLSIQTLKQFFVEAVWKTINFAIKNPEKIAKLLVALPVFII